MVKETHSGPGHDGVRDGVDLAVHHELLLGGQLHEDHPEVGSSQIKGQELAILLSIWQFSHEGWKAFDGGALVAVLGEAHLDGVPHLLLQHVDMVVVQHEISDEILDQSEM